jgi:hypothetical protein
MPSTNTVRARYQYVKLFVHRLEDHWFVHLRDTKRDVWVNHDEAFLTAEKAQGEAIRVAISHMMRNGDRPSQDPKGVVWTESED